MRTAVMRVKHGHCLHCAPAPFPGQGWCRLQAVSECPTGVRHVQCPHGLVRQGQLHSRPDVQVQADLQAYLKHDCRGTTIEEAKVGAG